jgi:hypothetical protein
VGELVFDCVEARADRYAASPTILFRLRIADTAGEAIDTIALRCQMRIEPSKRRYSPEEAERVRDLFGDVAQWGESLKPMQFITVTTLVPGFRGSTEIELVVPVTYDFEVASAKYFHSLEDGEIPLLLLFSGTVFSRGEGGFRVEQVPWHKEAAFRLPVTVWREVMDLYFPGSAWIRVRTETLDSLQRFKSDRALPTWDDTVEALLKEAGAREPGGAP